MDESKDTRGSSSADDYMRIYAARDPRTGAVSSPHASVADACAEGSSFAQAAKSKSGHSVLIAVVICVLGLFAIGALSCSATISGMTDSMMAATGSNAPVRASVPSIAVIDIDSVIGYDGSASSPEGLRSRLDAAQADDEVKGVILRVNSGGGTATAGEEMARLIADFPKPVVVVSAATNASAAYEISSQADYIFCAKTTSIGAIGVLLQVTDLSGLYEKLGIDIDTIASAESKDAGAGTRPLTDEERAWYQDMVDEIDEDFIKTVAEGRDMTVAAVKELANGLPYTGTQAVEAGLADEIGYFDDALAHISQMAGYDEPLATLSYEQSSSSLDALLDLLSQTETRPAEAQSPVIR